MPLTAAQAKDISGLLEAAIVSALKADIWFGTHGYHLFAEDKTGGATSIRKYQSADGLTWTDDGVVLTPGTGSDWDSQDVDSPTVWIEDDTWYMLYEGRRTSPSQLGAIGLATSTDGLTWTKYASNPVAWGRQYGADPAVTWASHIVCDDIYKEGSTYWLLIHAYTGTYSASTNLWLPGCLTSTDLHTWTNPFSGSIRDANDAVLPQFVNFMFCRSEQWDLKYGRDESGGAYLVYPIKSGTTRAATLAEWNGRVSAVPATPIIALGTGADWDVLMREPGNVIYEPAQRDSRTFKTWYTGHVNPYTAANSYVGYAYSQDGATWTKYPSNPLIPGRSVEDPYVVTQGLSGIKWIMEKYVPLEALTTWTAKRPMLAVLATPGEQSPGAFGAYEQRMECSIEYRDVYDDMTTGWANMQGVIDRLMRWIKDECWGTGKFNGFLDDGAGWIVSGPTSGIQQLPLENEDTFALAAIVSFGINLTVII